MRDILRMTVRLVDWVNWFVGWALAALLSVMTVLIAWQVVARYIFGNSLTFSEEVARFSMVWMTMLGTAYAYRHGSLIAVDILGAAGSPAFSRMLRILIALITLAFAWVLLKHGLSITERVSGQTAPSTRVSMAWLYGAMPTGAMLIMLNATGIIADELSSNREVQP